MRIVFKGWKGDYFSTFRGKSTQNKVKVEGIHKMMER